MFVPALGNLNLNLLKVFAAIYSTRHLTRAAGELQMTQPAVSHALARLREQTGDPLFVRSPDGMIPTVRADELAPVVLPALRSIEEALSVSTSFAPAEQERTFLLGVGEHASMVVLPELVSNLEREAPGVSLRVVHLPHASSGSRAAGDLQALLDRGVIDVAIATAVDPPAARYGREVLFTEEIVCACARDNPLPDRLTLNAYLAATHVRVVLGDREETPIDEWLAKKRAKRRVVMTVPYLAAALKTVASTDMVATVPLRTAQALAAPKTVRFLKLPIPSVTTDVVQIWHRRYTDDPAHRWLRGLVVQSSAGSNA